MITNADMPATDEEAIVAVLRLHLEGSALKDVVKLREAFAEEALFYGTDDAEKWTRDTHEKMLTDSKSGWDMRECLERHVLAIPGLLEAAVFSEVLRNTKYGLMRGTGTVVREGVRWKIAFYSLSFSVPNRVVNETCLLEILAENAW